MSNTWPPSTPPSEGVGASDDTPPTCPRHPDSVTYVTCQRCGQPTCPECQRPAPVGVQCVGCVKKTAALQRSERTVYGGRAHSGQPVVTVTLIGICVVLWIGEQVSDQVFTQLAFASFVGQSEPWRFLTGAFLHSPAGLFHIGGNMISLWVLGSYLESWLGRSRFLTAYLLSAVGGNVAWLWFSSPAGGPGGSWYVPVVGASGAVFGLFSLVLLVGRDRSQDMRFIYVVIALNVVLGFVIPGIAWQAHLGGFLVGLASGTSLVLLRGRDAAVQWVLFMLIGVLIAVAAVARYAAV